MKKNLKLFITLLLIHVAVSVLLEFFNNDPISVNYMLKSTFFGAIGIIFLIVCLNLITVKEENATEQ